jgi:fatty acid desaturase
MTATTEQCLPYATAASGNEIAAIEWPTLALTLATYGGWLAITASYGHVPLALVASLGTVLVTLHGSLQHEIIHGHPTRNALFNRLTVVVPLSLWLPYARYRRSHLAHHIDARLTDPFDDPESFYWTPEAWTRLGPIRRAVLRLQQTLAGRIIIGCFWRIGMFLAKEARAVLHNRNHARRDWIEHLLWCVPVVLWVKGICAMPLWIYFVTIVIPANGLQLIRSFAEHRARTTMRERIAIVESSWILGPLFLFNNLHALHHEAPMIPWYRYNARYRLERERLIAENGALVYRTYLDVVARYLFRPHDTMLHPSGRIPPEPNPKIAAEA